MNCMKFDILTLFPEMFGNVTGKSILGNASRAGLININCIDIRDFSKNKHRKTDDAPYGGGTGMIMTVQPIYDAWLSVRDFANAGNEGCSRTSRTLFMSPGGKPFNHAKACELTQYKQLIILCGHYEGVDERVIEEIVDEEISLGDFVLTGGEIAAMAVIDAVARLLPGVLPEGAAENESHANGLLEYPHYTRPEEILGKKVPEILLSGNHAKIEEWRLRQSIDRTRRKRPDLYDRARKAGCINE